MIRLERRLGVNCDLWRGTSGFTVLRAHLTQVVFWVFRGHRPHTNHSPLAPVPRRGAESARLPPSHGHVAVTPDLVSSR